MTVKEIFDILSHNEKCGLLSGLFPSSLNSIYHCNIDELIELITYAQMWKVRNDVDNIYSIVGNCKI